MFRKLMRTVPTWVTVPLRLALGLTFMAHGSQKVFGAFKGPGLAEWTSHPAPMGLRPAALWLGAAAFSELIGGTLVLLGLITRVGAFLIACVMTVAIAGVHGSAFFLPRGMEYAMVLLAIALALLIAGGGKASVDAALAGPGGRRR